MKGESDVAARIKSMRIELRRDRTTAHSRRLFEEVFEVVARENLESKTVRTRS